MEQSALFGEAVVQLPPDFYITTVVPAMLQHNNTPPKAEHNEHYFIIFVKSAFYRLILQKLLPWI